MKKALLIGNNYTGQSCQLSGCINDVTAIQNILLTKYKFPKTNVRMITDASKQTTLNEMNLLMQGAKLGDTLFFYYSGHGQQIPNANGTTFNEAIYTCDLQYILDSDFFNIMVSKTNKAKLVMCYDCCHSGDLGDLVHNVRYDPTHINNYYYWSIPHKEVSDNIIIFSGCQDYQTSTDGTFELKKNGAFTYNFLNALLKNNYKLTNLKLLQDIYKGLSASKYKQIPQLSCSQLPLFNTFFL